MSQKTTGGFGPDDDDRVVEILKKWDGGPISDKLFTVLAGMIPQPIVETVILRQKNNVIETLLIPRPADDIVWKGKMHTPGCAIRRADYYTAGKTPLECAFERIQSKELVPIRFIGTPAYVGVFEGPGDRGPGIARVFVAQIPEDAVLPAGAEWYPVSKLPDRADFVHDQYEFIKFAANYYRDHRLMAGCVQRST